VSAVPKPLDDLAPLHNELVTMTLRACLLAKTAVAKAADGLGSRSSGAFRDVADCEIELDRLDREIDERVTFAVSQMPAEKGRELLSCMKFMIDLERIGDLVCAFASHAQVLDSTTDMEDVRDLLRIAALLEKMLTDAYAGFSARSVDSAVAIVCADAEVDRLRNLMFIRHIQDGSPGSTQSAIHILFMAQALERAGDHCTNLAEEICHLVTGHSIRHARRNADKSQEQMYLDWLREQGK
jgi:phosphate transport system protein